MRISKTGIKVIEREDQFPDGNTLTEQLLTVCLDFRRVLEQVADVTDNLQNQIDELKTKVKDLEMGRT